MNKYLEKISSKSDQNDRLKSFRHLAEVSGVGAGIGGFVGWYDHNTKMRNLTNPQKPPPLIKRMDGDLYKRLIRDYNIRVRTGKKLGPALDRAFKGKAIRRGALKGAAIAGGVNLAVRAIGHRHSEA